MNSSLSKFLAGEEAARKQRQMQRRQEQQDINRRNLLSTNIKTTEPNNKAMLTSNCCRRIHHIMQLLAIVLQVYCAAATNSAPANQNATLSLLSSTSTSSSSTNTNSLTSATATTSTINNSDNINSRLMAAPTTTVAVGGPLEQVAKAEALTSSSSSSSAQSGQTNSNSNNNNQNKLLFEVCRLQSRTEQKLTNLSQIMFQPSDVCSSWHKMMRTPINGDNIEQKLASYPWYYIEQLNLSQNNLTVLHDLSGMSRLFNLLELRITHNQLSRCEESSLVGLHHLQHLDLSNNKLISLPTKFFQPVKHTIKKLNLSFNSISVLPPALFESLTMLEYLDLSHNGITSHWINERLFENLTQLHYLDLSFNKLTLFNSQMAFSSLQRLETLSLQHNELRQVPDTIQHLHYLSSLDLSQNFIHDITNASYLSNCRLLFNLNLESNLLENITRDAFSDLPALKVLNLANNKIHHLDQQAFDYVPDLHALRLDSNRLIDFGQAFVNLRFLLMLNISSNRISSFDYAQIPLGLQWLDLHSNKIDKLNNFYYSPTAQQQFSANDINQHTASSIGQQWQSMLRLTTLDASFNLIKELDNTSLPESLETVQLNNNHIRSIASHTFSTKSNLTRINLSYNQLTTMPLDSLKLNGIRDTQHQLQQQQSVIIANGQKFVDIYLANNPYNCNCNMGWFSQLLLASSTLLTQGRDSANQAGTMLREHQLILQRQLPRIADANLISCHLPFARQSPFTVDPHHQWSPVVAANQLAATHHNHHSHSRDSPLILKQSELLASMHLCPYKSHCFALCYCCDFDACDCEMSCPENCSCYYDQTWSTNIVDCSANNQINGNQMSQSRLQQQPNYRPQPVKFYNIPDKIPMDVTELYLDGLELTQLKANALIGRRNLKSLYLNNSQLSSIEPKSLATQKALRVLQLNSNYLTELHGYEFEQQVELRELYLAHNQLISIANTTFASLRSLQILHLQNNQLYHLNFWSNLPTGHKLLSLNLGSNPWSCQCDQVEPMLDWLHLNIKHIHDRKSVSCQYNRTNLLHLLPPLLTSTSDEDSPIVYGSLNENYSMFDMRMCLNYTVYPIIQSPSSSPSPLSQLPQLLDNASTEQRDNFSFRPRDSSQSEDPMNGTNTFILQPNDEPFMIGSTSRPHNAGFHSNGGAGGLADQMSPNGYLSPPSSTKSPNIFSSSFLLGATSMILIIVVVILSLLHYRRSMGMWFYSRYGLNMFSATKAHNHATGSLGKLSQLHHHHQHPHLHHHQCGASSTGSTSSSSAASSNLSQALCQQQSSNAASSGLVTTPLIVTNNHQLLNSATTTTTTTTSPYNDDEKLFDAFLTYSKLDEQFINDFIAPELEYGQPSYRVALHYRDLPVTTNEFLTDCIIETANASRRIIMILSEQMLKTEWMQYEFRTAHLEALKNNYRHRLIVIMLGQPSLANLDSDILLWLKSCTCIQWGDKMFWQRLRFAMPELPFNRQQPQYLRYQTLAPHQTGKQKHNLGANLLKSAGLLGGYNHSQNHHHHNHQPQQAQQLITSSSVHQSLNRPLPQPAGTMSNSCMMQSEEHHYAHLTPATMIHNQQQAHTYHQPIYGDPQQQVQQQQQQCTSSSRDNPTVPVHI